MTRPFPDHLDTKAGTYLLWTFLPILPPGDPRWDRCSFVGGSSTADARGYGAGWEIRGRRLYLTRFGGSVRPDDPYHQYRKSLDGAPGGKIQVGMPDVHEVDEPVFASWVTADLNGASRERLDGSYIDGPPRVFHLFRVERGRIVADVTMSNRHYWDETEVGHTQALLDAEVAERGSTSTAQVEPARVRGLADALARQYGAADDLRPLARLLWQAGSSNLDDLIAGFTANRDPDVRRWVAYALGRIGAEAAPAVPMLTEALQVTEHNGVLRAVAYALASIGVPAAATLPVMIAVMEARFGSDGNRQIRLLIDQLGAAGEGSIGVLITGLLMAQCGSTPYHIADVLGRMGPVAVPPLIKAYKATETEAQRAYLARAFGRVGRDAGPALHLLLDGLEHLQQDWAREVFAEALAAIGLRSSVSLAPLRTAFRAARNRQALSRIAGAMASLGSDAVGTLIEEFEAADGANGTIVRTELAKTLGAFGPAAASAVECLATAAGNASDGALVQEAAEALRKIGAPDALLATIQTAALKHERGSYSTIDILKKMRPGVVPTAEAIRDLVALLVVHGMDPSGRHIAGLLGAMGAPAVEPLLSALAQAEEPRTRRVIVNALGQIGPPAAAALDAAVQELAAAQDDSTRLQLVDDVRRLGKPGPEHLETLIEVMRRSAFVPVWWRLGLVLVTSVSRQWGHSRSCLSRP
ncbi:HEAT repeat domain-containing protein [Methylobacterium soli]|uniref:HEAT repeat domain-containing protein n=1 Tax=Methylobacterium soli TaxID=553447 RepID=A0A6L3ST52_9HYPH|nr:HEAT repeat domain-containing protein [Methylobacterium soli]KAB1071016.1 HEAT repeat domain-containing protein [Methylobacterium soli]GJE42380.1 hypothetical protein AEGHOMDF_1552 [Methylobacterium soli]